MGLFSRKDRSNKSNRTSKDSALSSLRSFGSSQSSLRSPTTPAFRKMSFVPEIPQIPVPNAPDPHIDPAGYLRSIQSVRERCAVIAGKAKNNELEHFDVDMAKFKDTTSFVTSVIKRDFAPDFSAIPPHGRWQHFNVGGKDRMSELLTTWETQGVGESERCRRLLDLFLVSVLLDAGAGTSWKYTSKVNGKVYRRSEGLAIASLEMFMIGTFSSNATQPHQVDGDGLARMSVEIMAEGLQVSATNPMEGLEGRTGVVMRLSEALKNQSIFGADARPGNMLDYLIGHPQSQAASVPIVPITTLWSVIADGLAPIWPSSRTELGGTPLGDAWPLTTMPADGTTQPWETVVPFHKLSQWLCYSLMQPMNKICHVHFAGAELMTGLPEYRNGGLFIDTGVLSLKKPEYERGLEAFHENAKANGKKVLEVVPTFAPDDDVIVEWRAVTVCFLDLLLVEVNNALGLSGSDKLTLPQMLEAGSWKGGREMAEISRPNTQCPPIAILSDGTVF